MIGKTNLKQVIVDRDNKLAQSFVSSRKGRSLGKGTGGSNLSNAGSYL